MNTATTNEMPNDGDPVMRELLTQWLRSNPCPLRPIQAIAEGQVLLAPGLRHLPGACLHHVHVRYQDKTPTPAAAISTLKWQGVLWGRTGPLDVSDVEARISEIFENLKCWKPLDFFHASIDGEEAMNWAKTAESGLKSQALFSPGGQGLEPWTQSLEVFLQSMAFSQHLDQTLPQSANPPHPRRRKSL